MDFTIKKAKSQKNKKVNINPKKNKLKKSRGTALSNNFTKFGANLKVFRHRTDDTCRVTHPKRSQNCTKSDV